MLGQQQELGKHARVQRDSAVGTCHQNRARCGLSCHRVRPPHGITTPITPLHHGSGVGYVICKQCRHVWWCVACLQPLGTDLPNRPMTYLLVSSYAVSSCCTQGCSAVMCCSESCGDVSVLCQIRCLDAGVCVFGRVPACCSSSLRTRRPCFPHIQQSKQTGSRSGPQCFLLLALACPEVRGNAVD